MSEKRFKTKYYLKSKQGIILGVVKVNEEENVLNWNKVVDLLNSLTEENEQLRKQINDKDDVRKPLYTQIPTTTTITSKRRVVPLNMRHRWYW